MKKKVLILAVLLLPLCSCLKNSKESAEYTQDIRTKQSDTSSSSATKSSKIQETDDNENFDGDLPDYVEMNGRIYRIHSMKPKDYEKIKAKIRANSGDFASEKDEVLHLSNRKITLIESERVPEKVVNIPRSDVPPISEFDRVAMQMVGKYVPASFRNDRIYYGYTKFFDREWDRLDKNSLGHVSSWAVDNLAPKIPLGSDTLFYPFGGPDIAYALAFYPNASEYVLVGLEPVGRFKDVRRAMRDPASFEQIKQSLSTYLRGGYFITSEMGKNLWDRWLRGTMYLILLELAACNFEVANIEEIGIDSNGNEVYRRDSKELMYCSKIICRKRGEQNWRHVYYIRADLADSNKNLPNLLNFMSKRRFDTMFKSASYAIWDHTLSKARSFILKNSRSILQDDTGMPFDCYRKGWSRYAFGSYTEPTLAVFQKVYKQPRMAAFFEKHSLASIPFKIGYGFTQCRPNLLLAVPKKGEQRSIDRDFGRKRPASSRLPKGSQDNKAAVATSVDKDGIMAQVEELKNLKLQYRKDEDCENCGDKKDDSVKQYVGAEGNQDKEYSKSSTAGASKADPEKKISNFSKSIAAVASEASMASSGSVGASKTEAAVEASSSEQQHSSRISPDTSGKIAGGNRGANGNVGAGAGVDGKDSASSSGEKVSPDSSRAMTNSSESGLKTTSEAALGTSSSAKTSDSKKDEKNKGAEVTDTTTSEKSLDAREFGESANHKKSTDSEKSVNYAKSTTPGKSEDPAVEFKSSAKISSDSIKFSTSQKAENSTDSASFKGQSNPKKSEGAETAVGDSEEDLERRLAQVQER